MFFIAYLVLMNLVAFIVCGLDKRAARRKKWRIPEKTLFLLAIIGGSTGMLLAMYVFRHKTRHRKFVVGIPAILLMQVALYWAVQHWIL